MSTHKVFNGIDPALKARLQTYWGEKLPRLQKLLSHYRPDLIEIRLTVSHRGREARNAGYEVRGVIHLPTGTVADEADDENPLAAVDRVRHLGGDEREVTPAADLPATALRDGIEGRVHRLEISWRLPSSPPAT
jgi:ribosome-associated translation inhibitor RaiA